MPTPVSLGSRDPNDDRDGEIRRLVEDENRTVRSVAHKFNLSENRIYLILIDRGSARTTIIRVLQRSAAPDGIVSESYDVVCGLAGVEVHQGVHVMYALRRSGLLKFLEAGGNGERGRSHPAKLVLTARGMRWAANRRNRQAQDQSSSAAYDRSSVESQSSSIAEANGAGASAVASDSFSRDAVAQLGSFKDVVGCLIPDVPKGPEASAADEPNRMDSDGAAAAGPISSPMDEASTPNNYRYLHNIEIVRVLSRRQRIEDAARLLDAAGEVELGLSALSYIDRLTPLERDVLGYFSEVLAGG